MQIPDRPSGEIFAEYHGRDRKRGAVVAAIVALCVAVGGSAATVALVTGAGGHPDASSPAVLVPANFGSTLTESQDKAHSVHFELTLTAAGSTTTAHGDLAFGKTAAETAMTMFMTVPERGEVSVVFIGAETYVSLGEATAQKFLKIELDDPTDPLAASVAGLAAAADPGGSVGFPDDAIGSLDVAGPAVVLDGVEAVPYTVLVSTAAAATALGYSAEVVASLPAQTEYRYWIGPDYLLRKVSYESHGGSVEVAFTRWGEPVPIEAPTADQIVAGL